MVHILNVYLYLITILATRYTHLSITILKPL